MTHSRLDAAATEVAAWIFENSDDVFIVVRDGHAVRVSPGWTQFLGWSGADATGRSIWDFVHPDDLETARAVARDIQNGRRVTYEHRVLKKDGDYAWMRARAKRVIDGSTIIVLQDISEERRRVMEAAQVTKANSLLSQTAGITLWRYDPVTDHYEIEPNFARPFSESELNHRVSVAETQGDMHPEDRPLVQAAVAKGIVSGALTVIDFRNRDAGGSWRRLRNAWVGSRRLDCGRFEIIGLTQDLTELMTERDRAVAGEEAAKAADKAKAEFLSNISHELRTPLHGLLGALHLARTADDEKREMLMTQAVNAGENLAEVLSDIIEFADGESGHEAIEQTTVPIAELVDGAVRFHLDYARKRGLWLRMTGDADAQIILDAPKLRSILRILIGNALKFTHHGGVEISASVRNAGNGQSLFIEVQDTGIGISIGDQERLFERFHQVDGSSTRQFGGAGLGLARARQLATLMGGTLTCNSTFGAGSTFQLAMPVEYDQLTSLADVTETERDPLRVLVVDDNAANRFIACSMLAAMGVSSEIAGDGAEAVQAATTGTFDLVLMDIQMPVMDGVEATRQIRALHGPVGRVPIVALTANVLSSEQQLYAAVGMNGCLAKPLSASSLAAELEKIAMLSARAI